MQTVKRKYFKDWDKYVEASGEFLLNNMHKSRITFKYRNKRPSYGKVYVTNDNKSYYIKLTKQSQLDNLENYFSGILHVLANKPLEPKVDSTTSPQVADTSSSQGKKSENKKRNKKDKTKH